jgi:hypothetical protein
MTFHYATVSEAITALRSQGFLTDFNLKEFQIERPSAESLKNYEITDLYRYEGDSDPGDEATVYGVVSNAGLKGILVAGDGNNADAISTKFLKNLHY